MVLTRNPKLLMGVKKRFVLIEFELTVLIWIEFTRVEKVYIGKIVPSTTFHRVAPFEINVTYPYVSRKTLLVLLSSNVFPPAVVSVNELTAKLPNISLNVKTRPNVVPTAGNTIVPDLARVSTGTNSAKEGTPVAILYTLISWIIIGQ